MQEKCHKAFKFRLYPNAQQKVLLQQTFGCVRFVYNHYLDRRIHAYKNSGSTLYYNDDATDLTQLKKKDIFLKDVDAVALQQSLKHLQEAYLRFFQQKKVGFPHFKSKHSSKKSYTTVCIRNNIRFVDNYIKLPKVGMVRIKQHRPIPTGYKLKSVTISQTATGKYFASVLFEYENQVVEQTDRTKSVGLDYSMHDFYVDSNGHHACMPHFYRQTEYRLAKAQRKLSKMYQKGKVQSNRYYKQMRRVAILHEKISNQRKDYLHKLSRKLVDTYDYICIEDLDMQEMSGALHFGKSVHDNGWGMFTDMLAYKAKEEGKHLIKIDKWYPSSQTCHACGSINPAVKNLTVRDWICLDCGTHHDRDVNAAINILNEGLRIA